MEKAAPPDASLLPGLGFSSLKHHFFPTAQLLEILCRKAEMAQDLEFRV